MKLVFLFVGGAKERWLTAFQSEMVEKLSFHLKAECLRLDPIKGDREQADFKKRKESERILQNIKESDWFVLCDERGDQMTSVQFSKELERGFNRGRSRMVFCVGGAFGVTDEVRNRADTQICLSKLILNHHVAQTVCLEQVFRAISIQKNLPYHNESE